MKMVRVHGGLGNQLFQYAFYRVLKERYPDVKIDISEFKQCRCHYGYELTRAFNLRPEVASREEIESLKNNPETYYREKCYEYNPEVVDQEGDTYYQGLWQSEKYFQEIGEILRGELTFPESRNEKNLQTASKMSEEESVSLHLRRGDYLESEVHRGVCTPGYYRKAVEMFKKRPGQPVFYIFSDDLEWAAENIKYNAKIIFVDWNRGNDSFLDMQLMSCCRYNIIANSTFSWWGAWLNKCPDKIVIAPAKWFNYDWINTGDVIPTNWVKIDV